MWIDLKTGIVAKTHADVRRMRPNWSGPDVITDAMVAALNFALIVQTSVNFDPIFESVKEVAPAFIEGKWTQQWQVTKLDAATAQINLIEARRKAELSINSARLYANSTYFEYNGGKIAVDEVSMKDILCTSAYVALFDSFIEGWPGGWKTIDNSYVAIATPDQWKDFIKALNTQGQKNFDKSQKLKGLIGKASTTAELAAINWSTPA